MINESNLNDKLSGKNSPACRGVTYKNLSESSPENVPFETVVIWLLCSCLTKNKEKKSFMQVTHKHLYLIYPLKLSVPVF